MVSIAERLDREAISRYNLLISATDAISGASSTVNLYINGMLYFILIKK